MQLNSVNSDFYHKIEQALGRNIIVSTDNTIRYTEEPRNSFTGKIGIVLKPETTQKIATIVQLANETHIPIIPWGGGTGLVAGQVMPESVNPIIISFERLNKIRSISESQNTITVDAGVILEEVQQNASNSNRLFPLSMASGGSCTIGGVLATNAGGVAVLRYGNARDLCLGIEAVLPNGSIFNGLSSLRKDNTGYDLRNLLIGSEGTLGLITAATLKLFPKPQNIATSFMAIKDPSTAITLLRFFQDKLGDSVSAFELISQQSMIFLSEANIDNIRNPFSDLYPWYVLIEVSGQEAEKNLENCFESAFENDLILDAVLASSEAQRTSLWRIREEIPSANRIIGAVGSHDISLPIAKMADFIENCAQKIYSISSDLRINCFGHVGDGNLHYNIFPPEKGDKKDYKHLTSDISHCIHDLVHQYNGSFSAEHGIGRLKVKDLETYSDPVKLSVMRQIKQVLDPAGIMNPGAVLDWHSVYKTKA